MRRPRTVDVAARVVANVAPKRLVPAIDQARLDARAIMDRLGGRLPIVFTQGDQRVGPPLLSDIDPIDVLPRALARRVHGARRDLTMIARQLRGRVPSPFVERVVAAAPARVSRPSLVRELRVTGRVQETPNAVSLYLSPIDGERLVHVAGQFVTLEVDVEGVLHRRCYSFANAEGAPTFITIKRVDGGAVSSYLVDEVVEGDVLRTLPAGGRFTLNEAEGDLLFVAGGSGITPIVSLLETALERTSTRLTLVYGNRTEEDTIFADRLRALAASYPDRFTLDLVFEEGESARGRLSRDTLRERLRALQVSSSVTAFVCGPAPMMDEAQIALADHGVVEVREERFAIASSAPDNASSGEVEFHVDGRSLTAPSSNATLLDAALSVGLAVPFSCTMGGCGTCIMKVVDGEVAMEEPNALSERERAAGYVLSCVTRPCGPVRVELEKREGAR